MRIGKHDAGSLLKFFPTRFFSLILPATLFCGCSTVESGPPPTPPILVSAAVAPPVGGVLPLFLEIAGEGQSIPAVYREDVFAIDQNGKPVAALAIEEAGELAGGMETLASAVTHDESAVAAVARSVLQPTVVGSIESWKAGMQMGGEGGAGIFMLGSAASTATGLARGTYVAASSEARYLDQVDNCSLGSRTKWYWHNNTQKGFVYFPDGKYVRIRLMAQNERSMVELSFGWPEPGERAFDMQPAQ